MHDRVIHENQDVTIGVRRVSYNTLQHLVNKVLEHRRIDSSLDNLSRHHSFLTDSRDHRQLIVLALVRLLLQLEFHSYHPELSVASFVVVALHFDRV